MSLLGAGYESSDEEPPAGLSKLPFKPAATSITAAPEVSIDVWSHLHEICLRKANSSAGSDEATADVG